MTADLDPKPQKPLEPEAWECCQSGCDPCIFDRYWEALTNYETALQAWELRHAAAAADTRKTCN